MANLTWKTANYTFTSSDWGMRGPIHLFSLFYDGMRPKGETPDNPYCLLCKLPGIKERLGYFANAEEGKVYAENVFAKWIAKMGLEISE